MAKQLKRINSEQLVRKILKGERDFSSIKLSDGLNLPLYTLELQEYLLDSDLFHEPLNFKYSSLKNIKAQNLSMPYTIANNSDLQGSVFKGTDLSYVNFNDSNLSHSDLSNTVLFKADLRSTNLTEALLKGADISSSTIFYSDFSRTDLRGCKGLESTQSTSYAKFNDTIVSRAEEQAIRMILDHGRLFDIRN
ncbi:MAG: pentapeptide repeat-containing protein [Candidatus Pacearchaeota archaeon]|jgi:uncharacterized protein YjbI with pentapeptide repeats